MIVVVVIGILASIAYPSYQNFVLRSHRADAQAEMMALAQAMERCYTLNNTYDPSDSSGDPIPCATPPATGRYQFTITPQPTSYTIQAAPQAPQTADKCGTMTINSTGSRQAATAGCW
jgi:type IV pilus assembly protein PilE